MRRWFCYHNHQDIGDCVHTQVKQLDEVARIITGVAEDRGVTSGIKYYYIQPNSYDDLGDAKRLSQIIRKEPVRAEQIVCAGDVLIKRLNPNFPYLVQSPPKQAVVSTNLFIIRPIATIYPAYLAFLFEQPGIMEQIEHLCGASAVIKAISAKKLMGISIQIIPSEKQKLLGDLWLLKKRRKKLLNEYMVENERLMIATAGRFVN